MDNNNAPALKKKLWFSACVMCMGLWCGYGTAQSYI